MKDDNSDIKRYYNIGADKENDRLKRHPLEFKITCRHLSNHLPEQGKILEIGAGPGPYTEFLLMNGFDVTAVDISEDLLHMCRKRVNKLTFDGRVEFHVGDARDLSKIPGGPFDVILLMGPLYHLVEEFDRNLAIRQAHGQLAEGGLIVGAFISKYGMLSDLIANHPHWITQQEEVSSIMTSGRDPIGKKESFRGYFAEPCEIAPYFETRGFETQLIAGAEPIVSAFDSAYNQLPEHLRAQWLDLLFATSTEPSALGASCHVIYFGKKRS